MIEAPTPSGWTAKSIAEVARFFDVSESVVRRDWKARGMPGKSGAYPLHEIARWRIEREKDRSKPSEAAAGDPLLADARYRDLKTDMLELDLMRRLGELIDRSELRRVFGLVSQIYRNAGGVLRRQCGDDAGQILDDAIEDAGRAAGALLAEDSGDSAGAA